MAQVPSCLRAVGVVPALLGVVVSVLVPQPARAAEDVVPLPGATSAAVRVDLDRDGVLDLVRLAETAGDSPVLEAWVDDGERGWHRQASMDVPWPANGDVDAPSAAMGTALLGTRIGGLPTPLLVTTLLDPGAATSMTCCLTVHAVRLDGVRLRLDTHPVAGASGDEMLVLDFDADGTDELVAISTRNGFDPAEPPTSTLQVFGWRDRGLELLAERERSGFPMGSVVGDLDGRPGAELVSALDDQRRLERLAWDGTGLAFTDARPPMNPSGPGWPAGVLDGQLVYVDGDGVSALAWPAGGDLSLVRRIRTQEFPNAYVVGSGEASLLVIEGGSDPFGQRNEVTVYDESLEELGSVTASAPVTESRALLAEIPWDGFAVPHLALWGFSGPMPASGWEAAGWVSPAGLVRPDGQDAWRLQPMAPMLGVPMGRLGRGDAWLAVCEACWNSETRSYVSPAGTFGHSGMVLARTDAMARDDAAPLEGRYEGAIPQGVDASVTTLLARSSGAVIELPVPPGSRVVSTVGRTATDHGVVDDRFRLEVPGVGSSGRRDGWGATVLVIAPDTRFRIHRWEATYAPSSGPAVTAVAEPARLELEATIRGTVDPGTRIRVDGESVAVDERGGFVHAVWASPWPQTVTVTAVDPFGTERAVRMEVVGFLDPRGLPWVPIVAAVTLLFGALLFLRVPRPAGRPAADGDGALEELDGDLA